MSPPHCAALDFHVENTSHSAGDNLKYLQTYTHTRTQAATVVTDDSLLCNVDADVLFSVTI